MPSERGADPAGERRLHPASLIFSIGGAARNLLLPGIVLFFAARESFAQYGIMLFFLPVLVATLIRYWNYSYRLDTDELVIREGIVTRNERHVPYSRIQNIDLVQNPLQRLLGVAEVRVETAGGEKPEAIMRVLSLEAVVQMRRLIFDGRVRPSASSAETPPGLLHQLSWRDVLLFGVISNKGMVVVAALIGALWQLDVFHKIQDWLSPRFFDRSLIRWLFAPHRLLPAALWGIAALAVFVVLMRILSIVWSFLKFHRFRLQRRGDDLQAEHGLLTRVSKTIPRHRIQVLSTQEGPLHRLFDRSSVQVQTAGSGAEREDAASGRLWLAPLIRRGEVSGLLRQALPDVPSEEVHWQPLSERAWLRVFRQSLLLLLPLFAAGLWGIGLWAVPPALALAAWGYLNARLYARLAGYALVPGAVLYRSGWWVRRQSIVRFSKIQSVSLVESPFDRRNRMASVRVDTAGAGFLNHGVDVRYLDAAAASGLLLRLGAEAGRTSFRW